MRRRFRAGTVAGVAAVLASVVWLGWLRPVEPAPPPWLRPPAPAAEADDTEESWAPLTVMTVVTPEMSGAVGDGVADDTEALAGAFESLPPAGGIVWLAPGRTYRTSDVVRIERDHVKLWAPNGQATISAVTGGADRRQALVVDGADGVGVFGPVLRSDADRRRTALEDSAIVLDGTLGAEVVGAEVVGSASAAVLVFGATQTVVNGNHLHHNWADGIHFTDGAEGAWVWDNTIYTEPPTAGDDGVACVTYGSGRRCGAMEWWANTLLGNGWGRGLAVVGGTNIRIHDNLVRDTGAAGILVASEPSYDTPGSDGITIDGNVVYRAGHAVPHPGILISAVDGAITDVAVTDNVVVDTAAGEPVRIEGEARAVTEAGTSTSLGAGWPPLPSLTDGPFTAKDTTVLATRDASFVPRAHRHGLYRIHVRPGPDGGFEQRLEYVVAGAADDLDTWSSGWDGNVARFDAADRAGDVDGYLVVRSAAPLVLPSKLRAVSLEELRAAAADRPELWSHLDAL